MKLNQLYTEARSKKGKSGFGSVIYQSILRGIGSLNKLAAKLGVHKSTVSRWLTGNEDAARNPLMQNLKKLDKAVSGSSGSILSGGETWPKPYAKRGRSSSREFEREPVVATRKRKAE